MRSGEQYQNWIYYITYHLECKNALKNKITGMVTRKELIEYIRQIEKDEWLLSTDLEKQDGEVDLPHTRVQIANAIKGLKGRKLVKEYKNRKGELCIRTI